jgi:hypothetical protein
MKLILKLRCDAIRTCCEEDIRGCLISLAAVGQSICYASTRKHYTNFDIILYA